MTALTANKQLKPTYIEPIGATMTWKGYTTADEFYQGALLTWNSKTGYVQPAGAIGEGEIFIGFCTSRLTSTAAQFPEISVDPGGAVLESIAVTGVTGVTDIGKLVYVTDDNIATATLTRAATDCIPIGKVIRHRSSTTCDVLTFTFREAIANTFGGAGRYVLFEGTFTAGATRYYLGSASTGLKLNGSGKIVAIEAYAAVPAGNDSDNTNITFLISNTAITSATIPWIGTGNQTAGLLVVNIVQPTALNAFYDGDTLAILGTTTSGTPDGEVYIRVIAERGV